MGASKFDPVGLPLDRVDGRLKVTGKATYAYEYAGQDAALYGVIAPASVAKGRVAAVDVREAQAAEVLHPRPPGLAEATGMRARWSC